MAKYIRTFLWSAILLIFLFAPLMNGCATLKKILGPQYQTIEIACPDGPHNLKIPNKVNKDFMRGYAGWAWFWEPVYMMHFVLESPITKSQYNYYGIMADDRQECPGIITMWATIEDEHYYWIYKNGIPMPVNVNEYQKYIYNYVGRELGGPGEPSKLKQNQSFFNQINDNDSIITVDEIMKWKSIDMVMAECGPFFAMLNHDPLALVKIAYLHYHGKEIVQYGYIYQGRMWNFTKPKDRFGYPIESDEWVYWDGQTLGLYTWLTDLLRAEDLESKWIKDYSL